MIKSEFTAKWREERPAEVEAAREKERAVFRQCKERRRQRRLEQRQTTKEKASRRPARRPTREEGWHQSVGRKLSDDEVREILNLQESEMAGALAKKYSCSRSAIMGIWKHRTHRHITCEQNGESTNSP
jgi:hypothetical protein